MVISLSLISCYKLEHLSNTENKIVTRVDYVSPIAGNKTYFTPTNWNRHKKPNTFIMPIYSGLTDGYQVIFYWERDTCVFSYYTGKFIIENPQKLFKIDKVNVEKFMEMRSDSTGYYIFQCERKIF